MQPLRHILGDAIEQKCRGTERSARDCRARSKARSNRMGAVFGFGAMPVGTPVGPHLAIRHLASTLERRTPALASANGRRGITIPFHRHPSARRAATCRGAWSHAARLALDIALPTLCVACREPVDGEGVCAACWAKLSFIAPPYCPRLGIPFVYDPGPDLLSMEAIANPPAYARARAAVRYDDVARTLVHALKYQDRTDLAPAMGRWMARAGRELLERGRRAGSGAAALAARLEPPLQPVRRAGAVDRAAERRQGGCPKRCGGCGRPSSRSACPGRSAPATCRAPSRSRPIVAADIQGRRVVLIDDVLTSGATVDACARALLRAKAASVDVLVFARVVDTHKAPI